MKKSEAKVGVRVRVKGGSIGEVSNVKWKGLEGTIRCLSIRCIPDTFYPVGVEFDKPPKSPLFHDLGGLCKDGYGRWGYFREFEVIKKGKKERGK